MIKDITILIAGAAGQGIQTIGTLLARVCHRAGLFIFSSDDFESRIRGGHSFHLLRIGTRPLVAPSLNIDILAAVNERDYEYHRERLGPKGIALINSDTKKTMESHVFYLPFDASAKAAGGMIASNTVAAGALLAIIGAKFKDFETVLKDNFRDKSEEVLKLNLTAGKQGYDMGRGIEFPKYFDFTGGRHGRVFMTGAKAAALGALAADCRFFSFYPMSPGTGIISNAAQYGNELPIVIEQAEDELAAINMAVGASFAGVRSLTATSGGGFCLMTEGLGLAAMTETPVVIVLAQRPGPATGLATRTAQADLLFSIYASQDEFPRFVFAPGSVLETFNTVKKAFYLSEKYQVPAIVLMDQFLADSAGTETGAFQTGHEHETFLDQETQMSQDQAYFRYKLTETGISPRKVPCLSDALVRATGNEHSEEGLSSEDPRVRTAMVEKRFRKQVLMKDEMRMPLVFCEDSSFYLTGWGSTKGSIMEACLRLREEGIDVGWVIFEDIWPLDSHRLKTLLENKKLIMVEGNATCQLGRLIRQETGIDYVTRILKYDGRPFYPEYIIERAKQIMGK
jgi:2-oxoglutarate ferredoxin oxidoreductase subunit alpha